jgi:hypothetical protein
VIAPPSPSRAYWLECGKPAVEDEESAPEGARCCLCASPLDSRGVRLEKAGCTFVNQTNMRTPQSPWLCSPCLWSTKWKCPPGRTNKAKADGSEAAKGLSPAMLGHRWEVLPDGSSRYGNHSKADKADLRTWLRAAKASWWWCTIADSGKKHTIAWAPLNYGQAQGATVLLDEQEIALGDWALVDDMTTLLTAGATKASVERGDYNAGEWERCADLVRAFEARWAGLRGSGWFTLAVWLAQRDEGEVAARLEVEKQTRAEKKAAQRPVKKTPAQRTKKEKKRDARRSEEGKAQVVDGRGAPRSASAVSPDPGLQRAEALGSDHEPSPSGGTDDRGSGRVVHEDAPRPPDPQPQQVQLGLFAEPIEPGPRVARGKRLARPARS